MRKLILLLVLPIVYCIPTKAQRLNYNESELLRITAMTSLPVDIDNLYADIKGNPFFNDQWLPGAAINPAGQRLSGLRLKFDWYRNKFYANYHDTVYDLSSTPFTRCVLYPSPDTTVTHTFYKGLLINGIEPGKFVQVLADGRLTLAKYRTVIIKDIHDEGVLSTTRSFIGQDYYYLVRNSIQSIPVRLNKKTLEKELADKWTEIAAYAKEKAISFNDEEGWTALIAYYNTLQK
jgi:hypothetical protein